MIGRGTLDEGSLPALCAVGGGGALNDEIELVGGNREHTVRILRQVARLAGARTGVEVASLVDPERP